MAPVPDALAWAGVLFVRKGKAKLSLREIGLLAELQSKVGEETGYIERHGMDADNTRRICTAEQMMVTHISFTANPETNDDHSAVSRRSLRRCDPSLPHCLSRGLPTQAPGRIVPDRPLSPTRHAFDHVHLLDAGHWL